MQEVLLLSLTCIQSDEEALLMFYAIPWQAKCFTKITKHALGEEAHKA